MRSLIIVKIKTYSLNKKMRARVITIRNKASSKNNAACTSTDNLIVKNHVDAFTSTDNIIVKNHVDACTSTDDLIVKNHVDACTSNDDICTNENKPSTNKNKPSTNENEPCTNENEPCTNENKPCTNENEPCTNENDNDNGSDNDSEADDDDDSEADDDDDVINVNNDFSNLSDKTINNLIIVAKINKNFFDNSSEISVLISEAENMPRHDFLLKRDKYKKINKLNDNLLDYIWKTVYGENEVNNEINSIDIDKKKMLRDI